MLPRNAPAMVEIELEVFMDLLHWSRRYVDGRKTGVTGDFNRHYKWLAKKYPWLTEEQSDKHVCPDFPYATNQ